MKARERMITNFLNLGVDACCGGGKCFESKSSKSKSKGIEISVWHSRVVWPFDARDTGESSSPRKEFRLVNGTIGDGVKFNGFIVLFIQLATLSGEGVKVKGFIIRFATMSGEGAISGLACQNLSIAFWISLSLSEFLKSLYFSKILKVMSNKKILRWWLVRKIFINRGGHKSGSLFNGPLKTTVHPLKQTNFSVRIT